MSEKMKGSAKMVARPEHDYEVGKHYVFSVPPGWIYAGTIMAEDDVSIYVKWGIYAENNTVCWDLCSANPKKQPSVCTTAHALPEGFRIRKDCITAAGPAQFDFRRLHFGKEMDAIRDLA